MNAKDILEKIKKSCDEIVLSLKSALANLSKKFKNSFQSTKTNGYQEQDSSGSPAQDVSPEASDQNSTNAKSDTTSATKEAAAPSHQKPSSIGLTIALSLLDIIASLVFIVTIVIAIKPGILAGKLNAPSASYHVVFEKIGKTLMKIETTTVSQISASQAFFVGLGLIIFGILKTAVLLSAKNGTKKIVSALTLVMTYFACFMISDKFLLFTIFILLLYFTFDYSCGFSTPVVLVKLGIVIISAIIIYVAVHFAIEPKLCDAVKKIYEGLRLPILHWW